ncbi:hypothetical protein DMH04_50770 [Kibdelosporangium aridum]|uniref:Guanylate cyclase domain-containing protein n=1 Tax=Kibdelosporangium aridum TaxID=2030 RepID=A0A428YB28_KIBAR|nr:hypothetical protein [Kibdelosporangium aridum]RSM64813.1 hypothetical protein DMH04_50770 [Kibdelosporangium aridum]
MISKEQPCYRNVFGVDVESSTKLNNSAKARMRNAMYDLVTTAFARSDITPDDHDPFLDRGDGLFALLRPIDRVPKTLLLQSVVPTLARLIDEHNACHPADRLRFRAVLHAGEVHYDTRAPFGETLDIASRLLDSPVTKRALRSITAPLVLAVSEDIYQSTVRHNYDGIDPLNFTTFMTKRNSTTWDSGWLYVPTHARPAFIEGDFASQPSVTS